VEEYTMVPNTDQIGCDNGYCADFEGVCQEVQSCFVDPCEFTSCEDGQVCESNYCGGCNARCVDDGMTENSATLTPNHDCPRGLCHNPDGLCEAEMYCHVDPCNGHDCEFGKVCQTNMCGGCHAVCAPDPLYVAPPEPPAKVPGSDCPEAKWHMSRVVGESNTCTNDDNYPQEWAESGHLFDTPKECCDRYFGESCVVKENCPPEQDPNAPGEDCPEMLWHMSTVPGGKFTCTNDEVYPGAWEGNPEMLLHSAKECCDKFFGPDCVVEDHCGCPKHWHMSITPGEVKTCTNDPEYPGGWNERPTNYIFRKPEECCQTLFDDPECAVRDVCNAPRCLETWHVDPEAPSSGCSNSVDYPTVWPDTMKGYESGEACCAGYFKGTCDIVNACDEGGAPDATTTTTTAATTSTTMAATTDAPVVTDPPETTTDAPETTTDAPETTTDAPETTTEAPQTTTVAPETTSDAPETTTAAPKTTTQAPVTTASSGDSFVDLTKGFDSFDDIDNTNPIPWIFGSPAQWTVDSERALAGPHSLKNALPENPGEKSELALKVRLPGYSMIRCYAFIDVAMPWDSFTMLVDDVPRYKSYGPSGEWVQVATGLQAGENTIKFFVQNEAKPGAPMPEERSRGSGFVWLDICEIVPMT
jgi:hypothetical protein